MGPRRWSRGMNRSSRRQCHADDVVGLLQSGPRRWCRGMGVPVGGNEKTRRQAFNGATTMVSWNGRTGGFLISLKPCFNGSPDRFRSGNRQRFQRNSIRLSKLQWGHDDGVVEWENRCSRDSSKIKDLQASMGPRRWSRGMGKRRFAAPPIWTASMGPRRWCRGRGPVRRRPSRFFASMGPRRWCRGMGTNADGTPARRDRFNGATTMVSWNGRIARKRRGANSPCFNGATTMVSWNGYMSIRRLIYELASMGPRRWSRGIADSA